MSSFPMTFLTVDEGCEGETTCDRDYNNTSPYRHRVPSPLLGEVNFNMLNVSPRPRSRSSSVKKTRKKNLDVFDLDIRPRTSSLPTKNTYKKPSLAALRHTSEGCGYDDQDSDFYRLRTFELTPKGIVNRGDSLKSRSTNSVLSSGSELGCLSRTSSSLSQSSIGNSTGSGGNIIPYRVLVVGAGATGKSSMVRQFTTSEYLGGFDTSLDGDDHRCISILLDGEESTIEFIEHTSCTRWEYKDNVDAYVVVYSTDDRQTFDRAVDLLYCIRKDERKENGTILVANKCDLERSRTVTTEEAKAVAKTYDSKFVETSTVVNHNIDELLVGILSQIRLKLKQLEKPRTKSELAQGCIGKSKSLLNKIFRKEDMSKSCENLYVL